MEVFGSTPDRLKVTRRPIKSYSPPVKPWVAGSNPACSANWGSKCENYRMVNLHLLHWNCWFESSLPQPYLITGQVSFTSNLKNKLTIAFKNKNDE
jgi:hypothetical protein